MSRMVVGTLHRKVRGHQEISDATIARKDMVVTEEYALSIIENYKNDKRHLQFFEIDEEKTEQYRIDSLKGKEALMNKRKLIEAEKSGIAAELIKAAAENISKKKKPSKSTDEKQSDPEKDKRKRLFDEAKELGLKVAKNISTEDLEQRVANGKELED